MGKSRKICNNFLTSLDGFLGDNLDNLTCSDIYDIYYNFYDHLKYSDYDIIIVSEEFEGIHFLERIYQLLEFWDYNFDVDILPYTPDEFNKKRNQIGIVNQAIKEGVILQGSY